MGNHRYEEFNDDDMMDFDAEDTPRHYTIDDALQALPNTEEGVVPYEVVMGLSELELTDLNKVRPAWQNLSDEQRLNIMERFAEITEVDFEMDFSAMARLGYEDASSDVRVAAINASYADDSLDNLDKLMALATNDASSDVRAAAISRIGQYIYLGEVEEIDPQETVAAHQLALKLYNDPNENLEVQRRALEAISHTTGDNIQKMIQEAYDHDDARMRVSAVNAMGNSCDSRWEKQIMQELESSDSEMKFEAIRSAGSLALKGAIERLGQFGYDDDPQLQEAAVWALGEIGGEEAVSELENLLNYAESNSEVELAESIEEAMDMAYFMSEDELDFELLDIEDDYDEDED